MKQFIPFFIYVTWLIGCSSVQPPLSPNDVSAAKDGTAWISDPSQEPLPKNNGRIGERVRILADFNANGAMDMALSDHRSSFGNAGGLFTLYLSDANGLYRKHGEFFAHPKAIALERIGEKVRLWTYSRGGGWIGQIGYYEVLEKELSAYQSITIHPGDSGTTMGNAIYQSVFSNSDMLITVEYSHTRNGVIEWFDPNEVFE